MAMAVTSNLALSDIRLIEIPPGVMGGGID
jgi:hypothetical protein